MKLLVKSVLSILLLGILFLFLTIGRFFIPGLNAVIHPMHTAIQFEWTPLVEVLSHTPLKNHKMVGLKGGCIKPLEMAAQKGATKLVDILMDSGAELTGCRETVLSSSVNHPALVEHLLSERGISPDFRAEPNGRPPIFSVVGCHEGKSYDPKLKSLEIMLKHGANPNYSTNNKEGLSVTGTPLYKAAMEHCPESTKLLLLYGADPVPVEAALRKHFSEFNGFIEPSEIEGLKESISLIKRAAEKSKGHRFDSNTKKAQFIINEHNITSWKEVEHGFSIKLTEEAGQQLFKLTRNNVSNSIKLYVETLLVSSPIINEPIGSGSMLLAVDPEMKEKIFSLLPSNKQDKNE